MTGRGDGPRHGSTATGARRDRDRRHLGLDGVPAVQDQGCAARRRRAAWSAFATGSSSPSSPGPRGHDRLPARRRARRWRRPRLGAGGQAAALQAAGGWRDGDRDLAAARQRAVHARTGARLSRHPAHRRRERARNRRAARAALATCEGRFQCDCRGVGTGWVVAELRRVATRLLGTVDIIPDPTGMADDFRSDDGGGDGQETARVSLRVLDPAEGARRVRPPSRARRCEELTDRAVEVESTDLGLPDGGVGDESRDYHVCIEVKARPSGTRCSPARVSLVRGRHRPAARR